MTITRHLSYANVASTLAVVLALGGGGAAVAANLGKNTVGSKQIKPAAVKVADLAPDSVDSSKVVPESLTGADIAESTLGKVSSASVADKATSADTATTAGRATNVLRAFVQADGTIVPALSSDGVSAQRYVTGRYGVVFPRTVAGCTYVVSPGISTPEQPPAAIAGSAPLENNPAGVFVLTRDGAAALADRSFNLVVVC